MIEPSIWSKLHGASTHFPIALVLVSTFCDGIGFLHKDATVSRKFHSVGEITLVLGAIGSYAAVFTGLVMTRGRMWGHDTLLHHHQFLWPAFALMTGLATWRIMGSVEPSKKSVAIYLGWMVVTSVFVSGAGYWGGELLSGS